MAKNNEPHRFDALHSYHVLETETDSKFDELTQLAASICDAPIAFINLLNTEIQLTMSSFGARDSTRTIPREKSVCRYTVEQETVFEIPNLTKDDRFKDLPTVKGEPYYKYYVGTQLKNPEGHTLGALCVLDFKERHLSDTKKKQLKIIANQVVISFELRRQNQQLCDLNKQQVDLMKILSHDLRSPLSGIIGMSELLNEMISSENSEALEMVSILNQSAKQLNQFVNDILNYTIMESKGFSLNPVQADVHSVVDNMKRLYMPSAKLKNIGLSFDVNIGDEKIWIDEEKFEQILGNLLSNAIKFTKNNGKVHTTLNVKREEKNKWLVLKVSDTGVGMEKEFVDNLFTNSSNSGKKGTSGEISIGLGLSIIKHFTELHNGTIDVDSKPGNGTTFTISLPLQK